VAQRAFTASTILKGDGVDTIRVRLRPAASNRQKIFSTT
jgi:hypothetical protein